MHAGSAENALRPWSRLQRWERVLAAALLFSLAAPGLLVWLPMWHYLKRQERYIIGKGARTREAPRARRPHPPASLRGACLVHGAR